VHNYDGTETSVLVTKLQK